MATKPVIIKIGSSGNTCAQYEENLAGDDNSAADNNGILGTDTNFFAADNNGILGTDANFFAADNNDILGTDTNFLAADKNDILETDLNFFAADEELYVCKICSVGFTEEHLYDNHVFSHSRNKGKKPVVIKSVIDLLLKSKDANSPAVLGHVNTGSNSYLTHAKLLPLVQSDINSSNNLKGTFYAKLLPLVQSDINSSNNLKGTFHAKQPIRPKPVDFSHFCKICFKRFPTVNILAIHLLEHSEALSYSCDLCGKNFRQQHYLNRHCRNHKCGDKFFCKLCKRTFLRRESLRIHFLLEHENFKRYPCPMCNRKFCTRHSLESHLQNHATEKQFSCEVCHRTFKRISLLEKHLVVHFDTVQYMCELCRKSFLSQSVLDKHYLIHSSELSFSCTKCGRVFSTERNCKIHVHCHKRRKYHCPLCGKHCISAETLGNHSLCHRKYDSFICLFCLKDCEDKTSFMQHFLSHTDEEM